MKKFPLIILIITIACSIMSCKSGGDLKCNIEPTTTPNIKFYPAENTVQIQGIRRAAILPFADYTAQQEPIEYREWGGNIKIMEEIIDQLTSHGISVVIQEDINSLLIDNEIIKPTDEEYLIYGTLDDRSEIGNSISSPEYELENFEHSEAMQEELRKMVQTNKSNKNANGAIGFGYLSEKIGVNFLLTALENDDKIKILSSPKILGLDNKEARIKQGVALPYLELSEEGVTSTEFKDMVLELKVTPKITPSGTIAVHIFVTKNQPSSLTGMGGEPGIDVREVETDLLIESAKTIVIGGIYETTETHIFLYNY